MQTAEECVVEAHGYAEHERARCGGRSAGVRFRLRRVVSPRRHLATRQCHNKHANCWESITTRITDLIKLCQRDQEGDSVGAQWFQDIRSALKREVQAGLEETMANSPADGWTTEQRRQILLGPQQFDLEDLEVVRVNAMQHAKARAKTALAKGACSGEGVGGGGIESRRQTCSQMDWEDRDEAAAGRGGDQWVRALSALQLT